MILDNYIFVENGFYIHKDLLKYLFRKDVETLYSLSGATFLIEAEALAFNEAEKVFAFDGSAVGIGISSGLLALAFCAVLGKKRMLEIVEEIDLSEYSKTPYGSKGKIKWYKALGFFLGKYLVKQNISSAVRKYISKEDFESYQNDDSKPDVFTLLFHRGWKSNKGTRKLFAVNLKGAESYDNFVQILEAGAAAQKLVQPVRVLDDWFVEGGQLDHNSGYRFISYFLPKNYISIYARPKNWELPQVDVCNSHQDMAASIEEDQWNKTYSDQKEEAKAVKDHAVENVVISFMDRMSNSYSNDPVERNASNLSAVNGMKQALSKILL